MNLSLDFSDSNISFDRLIEQLHRFELFPQLLLEIVTDDLVSEIAAIWSIDLDYTSIEFDRKSAEISKLSSCQGMTDSQIAAICDRELRLQKFKLAKWGDKVQAYFDDRHQELDRVEISMIQVEDAAIAQELFFRIQSGEQSFAEVALDYSQGIHAENGGILGSLFWRALAPGIQEILAKLSPGELSPLFQLNNYYTFLRLDEWKPAQLDDSMYQFILDELFSTWLNAQLSIEPDPTIVQ